MPAAFGLASGDIRVCVLRDRFRFTRGAPIAYEANRIPNEVHLYHGTLTDPGAVRPTAHVHVVEQLDWFEVLDDLTRYAEGMRGMVPEYVGPRRRDG